MDVFASGLSESKMRVHRTFGYLRHFEPTRIISDLLCADLAHAIWLFQPLRIASNPICSAILPVEPIFPTVFICRRFIFFKLERYLSIECSDNIKIETAHYTLKIKPPQNLKEILVWYRMIKYLSRICRRFTR